MEKMFGVSACFEVLLVPFAEIFHSTQHAHAYLPQFRKRHGCIWSLYAVSIHIAQALLHRE